MCTVSLHECHLSSFIAFIPVVTSPTSELTFARLRDHRLRALLLNCRLVDRALDRRFLLFCRCLILLLILHCCLQTTKAVIDFDLKLSQSVQRVLIVVDDVVLLIRQLHESTNCHIVKLRKLDSRHCRQYLDRMILRSQPQTVLVSTMFEFTNSYDSRTCYMCALLVIYIEKSNSYRICPHRMQNRYLNRKIP